jgi:hypothetical protein
MNRGRLAVDIHRKRLSANKNSSTDPDVTATAAILSTLRTAVDSSIGGAATAGAICFARPFLDFDRFLVTMMNPLGVRPRLQPDPDASLSKLIFDRSPPSHDQGLKTLSTVVNWK